jgi:hypothetical protein
MIDLHDRLQALRTCFESGATKSYAFRFQQLTTLKGAILKYEKELHAAL